MTLIIQDIKNNDEEITTWNGAPFVVEFIRDKDNKLPYFGFDWIELDFEIRKDNDKRSEYGKAIKHHGIDGRSLVYINNNSCTRFTHLLNERSNEYDEIVNEMSRFSDFLKKEFIIYSYSNLHTSVQWVSLPDVNTDINLLMKVKASEDAKINAENRTQLFFKIPEGVKITINNTVFDSSSIEAKYEITNKKEVIPIKVRYEGGFEVDQLYKFLEVKVYNLNPNKDDSRLAVIGGLKIQANTKIDYPVMIWPTIDKSKYSKTEDEENAVRNLKLSADELAKLDEKLQQTFQQAGINMKVEYAPGYITYDIKKYDSTRDEVDEKDRKEKYQEGSNKIRSNVSGLFFNRIIADLERFIKGRKNDGFDIITQDGFPSDFRGSHLLITDRESWYYSAPPIENKNSIGSISTVNLGGRSSGTTTINGGYAHMGSRFCMLFKNAKTSYGIYAHEIGHTLGCAHTFMDEGSSKKNKLDRLDHNILSRKADAVKMMEGEYNKEPEEFKKYLKNNPDEKQKYEDAEKAIDVFYEKQTNDVDGINREDVVVRDEALLIRERVYANFYDSKYLNDEEVNNAKKMKKESINSSEKILYIMGQTSANNTSNVMDYDSNHDDFYKWQWLMLRITANNHINSEY